jgi:radical SAM family RiPP maturation amino acid epimerase
MGMAVEDKTQAPRQPRIPTSFAELYSRFSSEEMSQIVQLKRFFECIQGDQEFRQSAATGQFTPEQLAYLRDVGVTFDMDEVCAIWKGVETNEVLSDTVYSVTSPDELPADFLKELERYPLLRLWGRFLFLRTNFYRRHNQSVPDFPIPNDRFAAWRRRRIAATKSELGAFGHNIDHPTLAIELAVGCSVGCYFCAFDAPKLQKIFDYSVPENREFFRGIARSLADVMGARVAGQCLLYWSTEPHDNPHYIDFMKEYGKITGVAVCTSTARYDEEWIRNLIAFYRPHVLPWPRISVLSKKVMQKLHRQFTPDEFRDVNLIMQQRESEVYREKVPGGRPKMLKRLEEVKDLRDLEEGHEAENTAPQGSIACISGFHINILEKTVKLTSPCFTTQQYPYGYRTFAAATFETVSDFDRIIRQMVEQKMPLVPYPQMPMRFRDDLRYQPKAGGFDLVSPCQRHHFKGHEVWAPLGELIARGDLTHEAVCDGLLEEPHCNPMMIAAALQYLFDRGFLDELDVCCPPQTDATQGAPNVAAPVTA